MIYLFYNEVKPYRKGYIMTNEKKNFNVRIAEKSVAGRVIPGLVGAGCGLCATRLVVDTLDKLAPEPVSFGVKAAYGVGAFCVGDIVGRQVAETIEIDLKEVSGALITLRSFRDFGKGVQVPL